MRPALTTMVTRALRDEANLAPGSVLLVAVSGGPDSIALLATLARVAPRLDLRLFAHGIDHGLRAEAAAELDLAAEVARGLGVPFSTRKVSVARGGNLQARARAARLAALAEQARGVGAGAIATGHHADDRAETLILRLMRGSGARGLAVMPPRANLALPGSLLVVRPLLRARRADVLAYLTRHQLPFATDPTNADPRFLRVRVRRELMPLLEALDPRIVEHLCALADELTPLGGARLELPRATQEALARLLSEPDVGARMRVWLPGGLVVSREGSPSDVRGPKLARVPRRPRPPEGA